MSRNWPELILFDAAGTLIEPAEPVERVYQRHFAARGWAVDEAALKQSFRKTFAGLGDPDFTEGGDGDAAERDWWRKVVRETGVAVGIDPISPEFDECFEGLFNHYAAGSAWAVYPEVREILGKLRAKDIKMAVVSNFDRRLHRVLEELGLADAFDLILTSADVSARKPSPRLLEVAMAHFSKSPGPVKLVGDSRSTDGGAAATAGVEAFILDRPRTTLADFADWLG